MSIRPSRLFLSSALIASISCSGYVIAQQAAAVPVHYQQGASHGFLTVRADAGAVLGYGELLQVVHGDRVTSRMTFHFRDGSIDDDTTIYSQRGNFHLISDHHVQHGPFFAKSTDWRVDELGNVTIRTVKSDGKESVETNHIDMPLNISNGITGAMLLNVSPTAQPFKLGLIAPTGKGRLIQLSVDVEGEQPFSPIGGVRRKATVFRIHPELGGAAGVVAPVIGKQPKDIFVWILEGQVPGLLREVGQLEEGGQVVSVESAGSSYPAVAFMKK